MTQVNWNKKEYWWAVRSVSYKIPSIMAFYTVAFEIGLIFGLIWVSANCISVFLTALLLDLLLVRVVKTLVRRRRPAQNRSDILSTFFEERYSFPSGHATRAAMCARFFLAQLVDTASMRVLVVGWAFLVSLSRLLLARHYVTDVGFGLAMGYCQYSLVERLWVTWDCPQDVLLVQLRETLNRAYGGLWMAAWKH